MVNDHQALLNSRIIAEFGWDPSESIIWLSPLREDDYAEYSDRQFVERLGLTNLPHPLADFWPSGGPHWDGLAKTASGKVILVEAKAHVAEASESDTRAKISKSIDKIRAALEEAKAGFKARPEASWDGSLYQTANRLAHLYFLHQMNQVDAWLLFLAFANDAREPSTVEQWHEAIRLTNTRLGLGSDLRSQRVFHLIWDCATSPV